MNRKNVDLGTGPVGKLLFSLALLATFVTLTLVLMGIL